MKRYLTIYAFLVISCSIFGQCYETKDFYLKGPVKKVVELEFESIEKELDNNYSTMDTMIFRSNGFLKYNRRYRKNGELLVEEKAELNSNEELQYYSKYHIGLKFKEERYVYDTIDNILIKSTYEDSELQRIYKFFRDSKNEVTKIETFNSQNQLVSTYDIEKSTTTEKPNSTSREYELNKYANYYEKVEKDKEGVVKAYWKLDYNDNVLIRTFYDDNGNVRNNSTYELDEYGNWTKETFEAENYFAISVRRIDYYKEE